MKHFKKGVSILSVVSIVTLILIGTSHLNIQAKQKVQIDITLKAHKLSGTLFLPERREPDDIIVFIHGDGPQNRTLDGGYASIMNVLLKNKVACYSYDKAGIGNSTGEWLDQTMVDRALEVDAIILELKRLYPKAQIGVMGFSQGGWVVSELTQMDTAIDYIIVVGGAIDWMQQHLYFETRFAERAYVDEVEKNAYLEYIKISDAYISENDYEGYVSYTQKMGYDEPMHPKRFNFAYINHKSNAEKGIQAINVPFLGLFGEDDWNVDAVESVRTYREILRQYTKAYYSVQLIPDATHELLKSKYNLDKEQLIWDAIWTGENIYAEGALDYLVEFMSEVRQ